MQYSDLYSYVTLLTATLHWGEGVGWSGNFTMEIRKFCAIPNKKCFKLYLPTVENRTFHTFPSKKIKLTPTLIPMWMLAGRMILLR